MKKYTNGIVTKYWQKAFALLAIAGLVLALIAPLQVHALTITSRSLVLSSSNPAASNATTSYTFNFTTATTATFQSFEAKMCTAPSGACASPPTGFSQSSSTFTSSTLSGTWTVSTATAGSLRASSTGSSSTTAPAAKQIVFGGVQNPTTSNTTFYARITLFSDNAYAVPVDTGVVAASTANQIVLNGTMDESLTFCVGGSFTGSCVSPTSGSLTFANHFTSANAQEITSMMGASTNANTGYNVTVNGTTLTCTSCVGSPTIAAMGTQSTNGSATTSTAGTAQFGLNLKSNTVSGAQPSSTFGADVSHLSGASVGTYGTNYGIAQNFRFFNGDTVATSSTASDFDTYTMAYLVNVPAVQPAGVYSNTLTYICTANF